MADHQELHPVEAPLPQVHPPKNNHPPAENPLQPPELQQLPAGGLIQGERGESKERPKTKQDYNWDPQKCCCAPGCYRRVLMENYDERCCVTLFVALWFTMIVCCCVHHR